MHRHTSQLRLAHFSAIEDRFAFLQESVNYDIYREAKPNIQHHKELEALGDDYWRDMNMDRVKVKMGEFAQARFEGDPGYKDWLREEDMRDPGGEPQ